MARTAASSTMSPNRLIPGQRVVAEDAIEVVEQQNEAYQRRAQLHISLTAAPAGWATNAIHMLRISFSAVAAGAVEKIRTRLRIDADVNSVRFGARSNLTGADTARYHITLGVAAAVTIDPTSGDNADELEAFVDTGDSGVGWLDLIVEMEKLSGGTAAYLRNFRAQDDEPGSLPSP